MQKFFYLETLNIYFLFPKSTFPLKLNDVISIKCLYVIQKATNIEDNVDEKIP